jgi:hypothetical protein
MTEEPKRRGRPPKSHLQDDHHFRPATETSDDDAAAGAPPATSESGQADTNEAALADSSISAAPIHEAVVENPTHVPDVDTLITSAMTSPQPVASSTQSLPVAENVDTITTSSQQKESPIEEKIHELVDINGWHPLHTQIVLLMPPRNGMPVRLSETTDGEGVFGIWKKTRKFANSTHRWEESGKWVDFQSGMDISFVPKYWRERF